MQYRPGLLDGFPMRVVSIRYGRGDGARCREYRRRRALRRAAARLAGRGHDVTLAADAGFERLAPGGRVEFAPIRADFRSLLPAPGRKRPSLREEVFPVIRGMLGDSWRVAQSRQPEVIVAHQKSLAAPHLAEKLGIPHVQALTVPMLTPTREFPLPGMFRHDLGGLLNRESYRMTGLLTRPYAGLIRGWRSGRLDLAPRGRPPAPAKTCTATARASCRPRRTGRPARWPRDTGYVTKGTARSRPTPAWRGSWPPGRHRSMSASAAASGQIPPGWARRSAARCGGPASAP